MALVLNTEKIYGEPTRLWPHGMIGLRKSHVSAPHPTFAREQVVCLIGGGAGQLAPRGFRTMVGSYYSRI